MKVMVRQSGKVLSIYVPKKDLEEVVVETELETLWGGWVKLKNGWVLDLPAMDPAPRMPITVNVRKRGEEE
jgi:nitrogen fixation protein NifT